MSLSETELKYVNSFIELQSTHAVASKFGVTYGTVIERIREAKRKCEHTKEKINSSSTGPLERERVDSSGNCHVF